MICTIHGSNPSPGVVRRCAVCRQATAAGEAIVWRPPPPPSWWRRLRMRHRPGDVLARYLDWLGFHAGNTCSCAAMQARMNLWGWAGCWSSRREIVAHLVARAKDEGIRAQGMHGLIAAGMRLTWYRLLGLARVG